MKPLTFLSAAAFLLFMNISAFTQEKNITIITHDGEDDAMDFFAFMPEMPTLPDMDGMEMDMAPGFVVNDESEMGLPDPEMMPDDLNITKEQTDKIKKIRSAAKKLNIPLHSDIQLKQMELKDLMDADSPDKNAVTAKVKEIEALRTQIKINRMNARIDCRNVFTKEQREKMEQMRSQHRMMFFNGGKKKMKFHREMHGE
jgi:Spy/CpxP family protein refolding chaperone